MKLSDPRYAKHKQELADERTARILEAELVTTKKGRIVAVDPITRTCAAELGGAKTASPGIEYFEHTPRVGDLGIFSIGPLGGRRTLDHIVGREVSGSGTASSQNIFYVDDYIPAGAITHRAGIQACIDAALFRIQEESTVDPDGAGNGGVTIVFSQQRYILDGDVFVNKGGSLTGTQFDYVTLLGYGTELYSTTGARLSIGNRGVTSNTQSDGISNRFTMEKIQLRGVRLELWGCQRNSIIRDVRITGLNFGVLTPAIYALFSSTIQFFNVWVTDNVGTVGFKLDTCANATFWGGGFSYNQYGGFVVGGATNGYNANSNRSVNVKWYGTHFEGNVRNALLLKGLGSGLLDHIQLNSNGDSSGVYPHIEFGGTVAGLDECQGVTVDGGYFFAGSGTSQTCIEIGESTGISIRGAIQFNGYERPIHRTANAAKTRINITEMSFDAAATDAVLGPQWVVDDTSGAPLIIPGTRFMEYFYNGIPANATTILNAGGAGLNTTRRTMIRNGSLVGLSVHLGNAAASGTATFRMYLNGVQVGGAGAALAIGGTTQKDSVYFPPGKYPYVRNDDLMVKVISAGWTVGNDVNVLLETVPHE